jgi:hypothetical protein
VPTDLRLRVLLHVAFPLIGLAREATEGVH